MAIFVRLKIFIKIIVEIISFIISVEYNTYNCNSSIASNYWNASHISQSHRLSANPPITFSQIQTSDSRKIV